MVEDFNNLENQATNPWTNDENNLNEINFQVFTELEINNFTIFENKDEKIDSSFPGISSNFLNKKRKRKRKTNIKNKKI